MTAPWLQNPSGRAADAAMALAALVPRIETERLILRAPRLSDYETLEPIWTGARGAYIGGPMEPADAWLDFNQCVSSWLLRGIGFLTVVLKSDGTVLGLVGFGQEHGDPEIELGWLLTEVAEGHGYATEAAKALLPLGHELFGAGKFVSYIHRDNSASRRLAERLGAVPDAEPHPLYDDGMVYRHMGAA